MLRPRIAISACLLGHNVRYDGGQKTDSWILENLGPQVEWVPVCPEVEAGMGVPRETVDIHWDTVERQLLGNRTGHDYSSELQSAAERLLVQIEDVDGHILKARSPSCGIGDAAVFRHGEECETGDGLYADLLQSRFPDLPIITEEELQDAGQRESFLQRVRAHRGERGGAALEGASE